MLEPTNKTLKYFSKSPFEREFSLAVLERYLRGFPNTPQGRKKLKGELKSYPKRYPKLDSTHVIYDGLVIPRWAIIDFYAVTEQDPILKKRIFEEGKIESLPSLEEVLNNSGKPLYSAE
jgi:hypothetical protein